MLAETGYLVCPAWREAVVLAPELAEGREAVLADLDGCLIAGGAPFEDSGRFVELCGDRLWIVSNNSTDTAESLSARLAAMGLDVPAARILLAGEQTLRDLAARGLSVALFADPPLQELARSLGVRLDDPRPQAVLLCRDHGFTISAMARALRALEAGAEAHLANPDRAHPGADGAPAPETGALCAALEAVRPGAVWRCIGKPAPDLALEALRLSGVAPANVIFIGDNPGTDGAAAAAAGLQFALLRRDFSGGGA